MSEFETFMSWVKRDDFDLEYDLVEYEVEAKFGDGIGKDLYIHKRYKSGFSALLRFQDGKLYDIMGME